MQVDDTEMINGLVFDNKASHLAGGPTRVENAKIGLIQFQISPPKTDIEQNVIVSDYTQVCCHTNGGICSMLFLRIFLTQIVEGWSFQFYSFLLNWSLIAMWLDRWIGFLRRSATIFLE